MTALLTGASLCGMYYCGVRDYEPYLAALAGFFTSIFVHSDLDLLESQASVPERLFSVVVHLAIFALAVWNVSQANPGLDLLEFFDVCRWGFLCR